MPTKTLSPLDTLTHAGKYLVKARKLNRDKVKNLHALAASRDPDPEFQALAILAVLCARVVTVQDDGWVGEIVKNLKLKE
jgi:hypothetical protein